MKTLTGWAATLAARAGVSAVTLRRWQRTNRMPAWARILLALLGGELEAIDAAFTGWIIRRGELVSPDGWCFAPNEIRTIPLLYGQVNLWRGQALALEGRRPAPPLRARRSAFEVRPHRRMS
jgi:transcriptional regulator with XRE-family HTH domain